MGWKRAQSSNLLVTQFAVGPPHGVALALMARQKRPGVRVFFIGPADLAPHTEGWLHGRAGDRCGCRECHHPDAEDGGLAAKRRSAPRTPVGMARVRPYYDGRRRAACREPEEEA
jgi:hypothetical protein